MDHFTSKQKKVLFFFFWICFLIIEEKKQSLNIFFSVVNSCYQTEKVRPTEKGRKEEKEEESLDSLIFSFLEKYEVAEKVCFFFFFFLLIHLFMNNCSLHF